MKFLRIPVALAALAAMAFPGKAAAEEETWTTIGTGLYRDNFIHYFYAFSQYPEVEVEVQESDQTPGRFRMVNPYINYPASLIGSPGCYPGDYYIIVDASDPVHCWIPTSKAGFQIGGNEMLIVGSIADDYYNNLYGDWVLAEKENRCGKLEYSAITFPPKALLTSAWKQGTEFDEGDISWAMTDTFGMFRLKLPGAPDIDVTTEYKGVEDEKLTFFISLGRSLEKALVAFVKDASDDVVSKVISGEIPSQEITTDGDVEIPYTEDGFFNLVVVPYYEGKPCESYAINDTMELSISEKEWRKAGQALYRDGIISGVTEMIPYGFVFPTYEYYVDVEESQQKPGYIRLVDPYGPNSPLSNGYEYDSSRHWYLYIDASDPGRVVVEHTEGGIGLDMGYRRMEIWSKAGRAMNDENFWQYGISDEEIAANQWYGRFENDEITFPKGALAFSFPVARPGTWYEANAKGETRVKFQPGQIKGQQYEPTGIEANFADDSVNAPAQYFHIDGTPASKANLAPGIYIVRQGSKTYKTVIK